MCPAALSAYMYGLRDGLERSMPVAAINWQLATATSSSPRRQIPTRSKRGSDLEISLQLKAVCLFLATIGMRFCSCLLQQHGRHVVSIDQVSERVKASLVDQPWLWPPISSLVFPMEVRQVPNRRDADRCQVYHSCRREIHSALPAQRFSLLDAYQ